MTASSLNRQWRPSRFSEMVGQEHVVTTLQNAVIRDQVAHAYIFAGPRGTGKTTAARLLAKSVNCEEPSVGSETSEPCNECDSCLSISQGNAMSVVEMDAASHRGIDDIRQLQERVPYASTAGRFRVYILDEVHMLTPEAFNALLKTLEEPPEHVIFILATTEPHKVPVTIQSRCQRFDFRYLTVEEVSLRLHHVVKSQNDFEVEESAVQAISSYADGAVRDALSLLEQCRDYSTGVIKEEHVREVVGAVPRQVMADYAYLLQDGDIAGLMELIEQVSVGGADMAQFIRELLSFFRDLMLYGASGGKQKPILPDEFLKQIEDLAGSFTVNSLLTIVDKFAETEDRARYATQPRFLLEMCTIRLAGLFNNQLEQKNVVGRDAADGEKSSKDSSMEEISEDEVPSKKQKHPNRKKPANKDGNSDQQTVKKQDTSPPVEEDLTGQIQKNWERIKGVVKQRSLPAEALLQPARPGPVEDDTLLLVFDNHFEYHRDRTQNQNRTLIEKAVEKVIGRNLAVSCVMEEEVEDDVDGSNNRNKSSSHSNPGQHNMKAEADTVDEDRRDAAEYEANKVSERDPADKQHQSNDLENARSGEGQINREESQNTEDDGKKSEHGHMVQTTESSADATLQEVLKMFDGRVVGSITEFDIPAEPEA